MNDPTPRALELTRKWLDLYRARGLQCLPSRMDTKRPLVTFARYWDRPLDFDAWDPGRWVQAPDLPEHPAATTNIQIMTGRAWGLLVIDLDGPEAKRWWLDRSPLPRTWITHSGGDGLHLWFSIPRTGPPIPKAFLWRGEGHHQGVERFGDKGLVMAPPSIHPRTGVQYSFLQHHDPTRIAKPIEAPDWLLACRPIEAPRAVLPEIVAPGPAAPARTGYRYRADQVLQAIRDPIGLVRSWGVRVAGGPNHRGWAPCHAIDRPDVHASAAVNHVTGTYVDLGSGVRLGIFRLAVALGIYPDVSSAINGLGEQYVIGHS